MKETEVTIIVGIFFCNNRTKIVCSEVNNTQRIGKLSYKHRFIIIQGNHKMPHKYKRNCNTD